MTENKDYKDAIHTQTDTWSVEIKTILPSLYEAMERRLLDFQTQVLEKLKDPSHLLDLLTAMTSRESEEAYWKNCFFQVAPSIDVGYYISSDSTIEKLCLKWVVRTLNDYGIFRFTKRERFFFDKFEDLIIFVCLWSLPKDLNPLSNWFELLAVHEACHNNRREPIIAVNIPNMSVKIDDPDCYYLTDNRTSEVFDFTTPEELFVALVNLSITKQNLEIFTKKSK